MSDIAEWKNGDRRVLDIAVINPNLNCVYCPMPPALEWALRQYSEVTYYTQLSREADKSAVLASLNQPTLNLTTAYRGQSFGLFSTPDWQQMSLAAWISYVVHREVPVKQEQYILWVKNQLLEKNPNG